MLVLSKKEFLEQFDLEYSYGCRLIDIIEDNGQEVYYCQDGTNTLKEEFSIPELGNITKWNI